MTAYSASEREAFYHMFYVDTVDANGIRTESPAFEQALVQSTTRLNAYVQQHYRNPKLQVRERESENVQNAYFRQHFPGDRPQGVGVKQSEYISLSPAESDASSRFIATDYLLDCNAIVLTARDAQGRVLRTTLAHTNITNDPERAINQLLEQMPRGANIEATLVSSPQNGNAYRQIDLVDALLNNRAIRRVNYYPQQASTVAVEVATGRIFMNPAVETRNTAYTIHELPIDVRFSNYDDSRATSLTSLAFSYFKEHQIPIMPLNNAYTPQVGFTNGMIVQPAIDAVANNHNNDQRTLEQLATELSSALHYPVAITYEPHLSDHVKYSVVDEDHHALMTFYSPTTPALEPSGIAYSQQQAVRGGD